MLDPHAAPWVHPPSLSRMTPSQSNSTAFSARAWASAPRAAAAPPTRGWSRAPGRAIAARIPDRSASAVGLSVCVFWTVGESLSAREGFLNPPLLIAGGGLEGGWRGVLWGEAGEAAAPMGCGGPLPDGRSKEIFGWGEII